MRGFTLSLAGTFLLSTNFITAKYGLSAFNIETFGLVWCAAAAGYSLLAVLLSGHGQDLRLPRALVGRMTILGLASGAGMLLTWGGLSLLTSSLSSFLWRFAPLLTILASAVFLDERLMPMELAPAALMIAGGVVATFGRWELVAAGVVLTLLACCLGAVQGLLAKVAVATTHPNVVVFYRVAVGLLAIAAWGLATGRLDFRVGRSYWIVTLLGALLGPCASFLLRYRALQCWSLSHATLVVAVQPLFVVPMAYLALDELPSTVELLGGTLILAGLFWLVRIHFSRG
jgi:drug/metabolite transporter (DMT)-like permease